MISEPATLVILAGGEAKRMGFPKHRLTIGGRGVLAHLHERLGSRFARTIVVGRSVGGVPRGVDVVEDRYAVRSPLVGIHGGLSAARTDLCFVVGCDMPHVVPDLVDHLLGRATGVDVVVPVVRGFYEPLCAAYRTSCLRPIEQLIECGTLKVSALYERVRLREVPEPSIRRRDSDLSSFANLNTEPSRQAL